LGELINYLENKGDRAVRVAERFAKTLNVSRVFIVGAALLLGFLLLGGPAEVKTQQTPSDGDLRLVDKTAGTVIDLSTATTPSGRLEIFDDEDGDGTGEWKGICDDYLGVLGTEKQGNVRVIGRQEAEVACRQLGFSGGAPITQLTLPDDSDYLLDDLECAGSEARILGDGKCRHDTRGDHNCESDEAFGVTCAAATTNNDAVGRLAITGTTQLRQTLTADHTGITDEDGKPTDAASFSYQWIRVDLYWNETEISGATSSTYTLQDADEENWIKVKMTFTDDEDNAEEVFSFEEGPVYTDKPDGSLRLRPIRLTYDLGGGISITVDSDEFTGLVEIYDEPSKKWKGVCDDGANDENLGWGTEESQVVCRQLSFAGGTPITQINGATYPPIYFLLDEVVCDGTEDKLLDCEHAERGTHDCTSTEYAGVFCDDPDSE
jgi:hypothetical protein